MIPAWTCLFFFRVLHKSLQTGINHRLAFLARSFFIYIGNQVLELFRKVSILKWWKEKTKEKEMFGNDCNRSYG